MLRDKRTTEGTPDMFKMLAAIGLVSLLSIGTAMAAPIDTITITGTWNSGTKDSAGLFGAVGSDLGGKSYTVTYSFDPDTLALQSSSNGCTTNCTYNFGTNGLTETLTALDGSKLVTDTLSASNGSVQVCGSANGCGSVRFDITNVNSGGLYVNDLHLFATGQNEQFFINANVGSDPTFLDIQDALGSLQDISSFDGDTISGFSTVSVSFASTAVPEPLTMSLFGAGVAGMAAFRRRRKATKT
jgi:hypothetical protein